MSCGSLCRELWLSGLGAVALAYADEATAKVLALGMLVEVPHTRMPIQSPWIAIMNRQTEIARKLAAELALPLAQRNRAALARAGIGGVLLG
jgi:hypothetical protein